MDDDTHSAYVIGYLLTTISGFTIGILSGWALWG